MPYEVIHNFLSSCPLAQGNERGGDINASRWLPVERDPVRKYPTIPSRLGVRSGQLALLDP